MYAKNFHVSIKDLRMCAKNPPNDYYTKLKYSNSGCFAPCAKLQGWNTYIPGFGDKNEIKYDNNKKSDIINFSSGLLKA